MKTKTFLLLCLFLGIGLTQLSAQNAGHAISHYFQEEMAVPLTCDVNTPPVMLKAVFDVHCVMFNTGVDVWNAEDQIWMKMRYKGTLMAPSGEVFLVDEVLTNGHKGIGTAVTDPDYYAVIHFVAKLKGNMGSHIIMSGYFDQTIWWDINEWVFTVEKAVCN
jgi:hypothetical protein